MRHNFSLEMACFTFAQEIIERTTELGEGRFAALAIDSPAIRSAAIKCLGAELTPQQETDVRLVLVALLPEFGNDCASFALAHLLFHVMEEP